MFFAGYMCGETHGQQENGARISNPAFAKSIPCALHPAHMNLLPCSFPDEPIFYISKRMPD